MYFSNSAVISGSYLVQSATKYAIFPVSTREINSFEFKTSLSFTLQVKHQSAVKFKRIFRFSNLNWLTRSVDHSSPISIKDLGLLFSAGKKKIKIKILTDENTTEVFLIKLEEKFNAIKAIIIEKKDSRRINRPSYPT